MIISRRDMLLGTAFAPAGKWTVKAAAGRVEAWRGGALMTAFHHDHTKWDKPFLFPLVTPSGRVLSRGWPVDPRPGETNDHGWHRGLFYGHGIVSGHDFWREQGRDKTATLRLDGTPAAKVEKGVAVLGGRFQMLPPDGRAIGSMTQEYRLSLRDGVLRILFRMKMEANRGQALQLGDTDDGGFGIRLADEFRQDKGARLRNSEGLETTEKIWGQPARWVHYATRDAGAVMIDHPRNVRHPGRWHARGYALCSANPFALRSFTKDKSADGGYQVAAGAALELRYCVLLHDGALGDPVIERESAVFGKGATINA